MSTEPTTAAEGLLVRVQRHRTTIIAGAAALLLGAVLARGCGDGSPQAAPAPQLLSGPTTTTTAPPPPVDPLANLGQLNPTAAALVGPEWDARRELARRASEVMTQTGADQCALVLGATVGGSWELSTSFGPAHPVVVFAGCPFPPKAPTTTTTAPKAG